MKKFCLSLLLVVLLLGELSAAPVRKLYITRHAQRGPQTKEVANDCSISKLGFEQARCLGNYLKKEGFKGKIYASPYLRTVQTAGEVSKATGVKVYLEPGIQEGVTDKRKGDPNKKQTANTKGRTIEQLRKAVPGVIAGDAKLKYPWAIVETEPRAVNVKRLMDSVDKVVKENPKGDILLVTHGGCMNAIAKYGMPERIGGKVKGQSWNCSVYVFGIEEDGSFSFIEYKYDYMPDEIVTSNGKFMNKIKDGSKKKSSKKRKGN